MPVGKPAVRTDRRPSFFCAARAVRPRLERGKKTHARAARLPRSATPWGDPPPLWIARARTPWFGPGPRPELFVCSGGGTQGRVRAAGGTWGATGGVAATAPPGRTAARAVAVRPTGGRCTPPRAWWPLPLCRRPPPSAPASPSTAAWSATAAGGGGPAGRPCPPSTVFFVVRVAGRRASRRDRRCRPTRRRLGLPLAGPIADVPAASPFPIPYPPSTTASFDSLGPPPPPPTCAPFLSADPPRPPPCSRKRTRAAA